MSESSKDGASGLFRKPLQIGNKRIHNRLFLAPMSGLGHVALRELIAAFGGHGLLFTEMCNARMLPHENRLISTVFRWRDAELPHLVCQLLGDDPEIMAAAAERVAEERFFGVDLNMGCAVTGICRQNCGAALLHNPDLAVQIIRSVRNRVTIPVFVKYRTGWTDDCDNAVSLAKRFQDAGADALTFHPRVAPDRRSRPPKWEYIRKVKENVAIPVFGNGNVFDENDYRSMLATTGCDGIAIGRIAVAKPWIFRVWTEGYQPPRDIYKSTALKMADLLESHFEPAVALKHFKKFALYFSGNFRFGHAVQKQLFPANCMDDIRQNIQRVFDTDPEESVRPNLNLFNA
ncbi:MAG: tRNA dihydrouridine synthase [Thermodesulfobacteriota bacterium]